MENIKKYVIIACLIGCAVLMMMTNTTMANKLIIVMIAVVGVGIILSSLRK